MEDRLDRTANNSTFVSDAEYSEIVQDLMDIEEKGKPHKKRHYHRAKIYQLRMHGSQKTLERKPSGLEVIKESDVFDVINDAHVSENLHSGRDKMFKALKRKYYNVTRSQVDAYLSTCRVCEAKKARPRSSVVAKPIITEDINRRSQVDLIDWHSEQSQGYAYILCYQDHLTKYVVLRPLKTKRAEEVAHNLIDIFCTFGAPNILQVWSESGVS